MRASLGPTRARATQTWRGMPELYRDERGAIVIMGIFMATMLVGFLYYVAGVGQTILYRERLQNGADAAAFSAAVLKAKHMNTLALLNIYVASVSAPVAMSASIERSTPIAGLTPCLATASNPASRIRCIIHWNQKRQDAGDKTSQVSRVSDQLRNAADDIADYIVNNSGLMAQEFVASLGRDQLGETVESAFAAPVNATLPVETDTSNGPCERMVEGAIRAGLPTAINFDGASYWKGLSPPTYTNFVRNEVNRFCGDNGFARRVEEGTELGMEPFQVRAGTLGTPPFRPYRRGVQIAMWNQDPPAGSQATRRLDRVGTFSVAQAEFYFDVSGDVQAEDLLWDMRWRARLRRLRVDDTAEQDLIEACFFGGSGDCTNLSDLEELAGAMVH